MDSIAIGKRAPLITNPLLIEGISRSGKFLLANVMNGITGIEPVQYHGVLENIPIMDKFGLINHEVAKEILQCEIDTHSYEMAIGRNFNLRRDDKSSVFNTARSADLLKRSRQKDPAALLASFQKADRYSFYILHESMAQLAIFFETFPNLKVVSLQRSPIDLVSSWFKRGHGRRWGKDPVVFSYPYAHPQGVIPWFAVGWGDLYHQLGEMDRVIYSILTLNSFAETGFKQMSRSQQKRILFVYFEELLVQPNRVVKELAQLLGKKPLPEMKQILIREHLPAKKSDLTQQKTKKINEIQQLSTAKYFETLMILEKKYQHRLEKHSNRA